MCPHQCAKREGVHTRVLRKQELLRDIAQEHVGTVTASFEEWFRCQARCGFRRDGNYDFAQPRDWP